MSASSFLHVAIIMDGNGRWATRRNLPRLAGHRAGVEAVRRIVEAAPRLGIGVLTLYAFSSDNWKRPPAEVNALMSLFRQYLRRETATLARRGVRLEFIGRRDRLPATLRSAAEAAERLTARSTRLHLRVAVDYSSRDAIAAAAQRVAQAGAAITRDALARALASPDVDLLIRSSGEQRLSDFLLWENAYAEFYFSSTLWPDFSPAELEAAVRDFSGRDRRYGRLPAAV